MSYIDRKPPNHQKALAGGLVALIQGGLALALVNGFAVAFFEKEPQPRTIGEQIELPPIPPEATPEPVVEPSPRVATDPRPADATPLEPNRPVDLTPTVIDLRPGEVALGDDLPLPRVEPTSKPPRFAPKAAKPGNDVAGWVTTDDYPTQEIRAGHQGAVRFQLAIDARGRVSQCTILASSGYPALDQATCKQVTRRARFDPATDGDGNAVGGAYSGTIRWVIPRD